LKIVYEIPDEAIELLKKIKASGGSAEFRDSEFLNVQEFKESSNYGTFYAEGKKRDEDWFFKRNFCNQHELSPLINYNLIDCDIMCWNLTYVITDIGEKILENLDTNQTTINITDGNTEI